MWHYFNQGLLCKRQYSYKLFIYVMLAENTRFPECHLSNLILETKRTEFGSFPIHRFEFETDFLFM